MSSREDGASLVAQAAERLWTEFVARGEAPRSVMSEPVSQNSLCVALLREPNFRSSAGFPTCPFLEWTRGARVAPALAAWLSQYAMALANSKLLHRWSAFPLSGTQVSENADALRQWISVATAGTSCAPRTAASRSPT